MKLLVSACLLGAACRYDGCAKPMPEIQKLMARHILIPVCPGDFWRHVHAPSALRIGWRQSSYARRSGYDRLL